MNHENQKFVDTNLPSPTYEEMVLVINDFEEFIQRCIDECLFTEVDSTLEVLRDCVGRTLEALEFVEHVYDVTVSIQKTVSIFAPLGARADICESLVEELVDDTMDKVNISDYSIEDMRFCKYD